VATRNFQLSQPGHSKSWEEEDHEDLIATKRTPNWYYCDVKHFIHHWMEKWESGELPRPTAEELAKLSNHS
jgi:hypothetical protein